MNKNTRLLKATTYYTIGNLGSKVISLIIVPLYTYYISTSEMGIVDVLNTTQAFIMPVLIMQITDGLVRWLLDKTQNAEKVIHCALNVILRNLIIAFPAFVLVIYFFHIPYGWWFIASLYASAFYTVMMQIVRGLGDNKLYASLGVINSIIIVGLNYLLIVHLNFGVTSFLLSGIVSHIIPALYIIIIKREVISSFRSPLDRTLKRAMVVYSIMLIPNCLNWQIMNVSDRYVILAFLGTSWNGIYSIANKFPTVISTLTSLFYMAWQETAIIEYKVGEDGKLADEQNQYYSKVFTQYFKFLMPIVIIGIGITMPFTKLLMSEAYSESWKFTGFLYIGAAFSAFSSFYGVGYQLSRKPKGALITTTIGSGVNLLVNLFLANKMGLQAASLSTFLAFFIMFIMRVFETKKYFNLSINWVSFVTLLIFAFLSNMILLIYPYYIIAGFIVAFGVILFVYENLAFLKKLFTSVAGIVKRKA